MELQLKHTKIIQIFSYFLKSNSVNSFYGWLVQFNVTKGLYFELFHGGLESIMIKILIEGCIYLRKD